MDEGLLDTIGSVGAELENLRRNHETETQFGAALEQKLAAAQARAEAARAQAELLEEAAQKADIQLARQERAAELAMVSSEVARQHASQLSERLQRLLAASALEQGRLAERVGRLEATVQQRVEAASAAGVWVGGQRPSLTEYCAASLVRRVEPTVSRASRRQ